MNKAEKIEALVKRAFSELHHDADYEERDPKRLDYCNYLSAQALRKDFARILGWKTPDQNGASDE